MKKYTTSLFLFHRDLRVIDNTALINALNLSQQVITLFIIDSHQVTDKNSYKSDNALQFMTESLVDLSKQLHEHHGKLTILYGETNVVLKKVLKEHSVEAFYCNADYTPFAQKRDAQIKALCKSLTIDFYIHHDALLNEPCAVLKNDQKAYTKFTPFYKKSIMIPIAKPSVTIPRHFCLKKIDHTLTHDQLLEKIIFTKNKKIYVHGGRQEGLKLLHASKKITNYPKTHDTPSMPTTSLSAHLKFGTISAREVFYFWKEHVNHAELLIRQLYWRDFFSQIGYHFPHVFHGSFHQKYDHITWSNNKKHFERWCTGTTGFPLVDAGMRQLNATGYMHNRVRMVVASFLTKDLHINWRLGERYFAQKLVDYDPAVNNGNWQWSASTGCDAQPYFRIFNPWLQQKKFDPECIYIKQWIPELRNVDQKTIHTLFKNLSPSIKGYPGPMVDHSQESMNAKELYRKL